MSWSLYVYLLSYQDIRLASVCCAPIPDENDTVDRRERERERAIYLVLSSSSERHGYMII